MMSSVEIAPPTPGAVENADPNRGLGLMNWMRNTRPGQLLANVSMSAAVILPGGTAGAALAEAPSAMAADAEPALTDEQRQECIDAALVKPEILKAQLQHTGNFDRVPLQAYALSTQSELWPDECQGLYSGGLQARGQAFHNGRWVNMNYWGGISIFPDTGKGYWPGYIGNLDNLRFPVCRSRILLKANIVDLSVDMNMNTPWKQHHPTIAKKQLGSIPVDILPRKPKACN